MWFFKKAKGTVDYKRREHGRHATPPERVLERRESVADQRDHVKATAQTTQQQLMAELKRKKEIYIPQQGDALFQQHMRQLAENCDASFKQVKKSVEMLAVTKATMPDTYRSANMLGKEAEKLGCRDMGMLESLVDDQPLKQFNFGKLRLFGAVFILLFTVPFFFIGGRNILQAFQAESGIDFFLLIHGSIFVFIPLFILLKVLRSKK